MMVRRREVTRCVRNGHRSPSVPPANCLALTETHWSSPKHGGLIRYAQPLRLLGGQNSTSPPSISAFGRSCCCPSRVAHGKGADVSYATDHNGRAICCRRPYRHDRTSRGRGHACITWSTHHHRKRDRCCGQHWSWRGLPAQLPMATRSVSGSGVATSLTEQFTRSHTT